MLDDLHFQCIFHKQSESEIEAKVGSGSEQNNFRSTTLRKSLKYFHVWYRYPLRGGKEGNVACQLILKIVSIISPVVLR
jgi:hypothetical protein